MGNRCRENVEIVPPFQGRCLAELFRLSEIPSACLLDTLILGSVRHVVSGDAAYLVVATTRPETMLGDTGVAVSLTRERLFRHDPFKRLTRVEAIWLSDTAPKGAAQIVVGEATVCLPLGSLIDLSAEKFRLEKAIAKKRAGDRPYCRQAFERKVRCQRESGCGRRRT